MGIYDTFSISTEHRRFQTSERMGIPQSLIIIIMLLLTGVLEGVIIIATASSMPSTTYQFNSKETEQLFNYIQSSGSELCEGRSFYNYNSFIAAANSFPGFGSTGTSDDARRDVAAFFANVIPKISGLCYIQNTNPRPTDYCDIRYPAYPCAKGKRYYGRGPLDITWNYNYGPAGKYLKLDLLGNPDKVSENSTISFQTAMWLWMIGSNCHEAIVSGQGFGATVETLYSSYCNAPSLFNDTLNHYKTYCEKLGVDPGSNLQCYSYLATSEPTAAPAPAPNKGNTMLPGVRNNSKRLVPILLGSTGGATLISFLLLFAYCMRIQRRRKSHLRKGGILGTGEKPTLSYFSYEVLKEATKNFDIGNKLGEGGFGQVYKGILGNGTEVAVKKLFARQSSEAVAEFHTEINAISGVLHRNLLRLLGYCTHGQDRLLVYEFMINKSLDIHLFGDNGIFLNWEARFQIITGTARGLGYLHEHSRVPVVHRDIKAANILLDENLHPIIADFGLAKLFPEDRSHLITGVGGTVGYTAPEYAIHGHLTQKADVYSYGVVVLEILSGRKCVDIRLPSPILLQWAWSFYERNESMNVVDPKLEVPRMSENEQRQVLKVIRIALLCVQGTSSQRPSMSNVLSMLTSDSEIIGVPTPPALIDSEYINLPEMATSFSASHATMSNSLNPR